jgi:anhydro-N-acetylmuramic acid kinase
MVKEDKKILQLNTMLHQINDLYTCGNREYRQIIGLMSGTSLDGLDIFYGRFEGAGRSTKVTEIAFETVPYNEDTKSHLREIFAKSIVDFNKVVVYNAWIGKLHGEMVNEFIERHGINKNEIDFIASHGQTVLHAPRHIHGMEDMPNATLQIGDGDHIAVTTGITTICDFRQKHIAIGGEGAPLAIYGDIILFSDPKEDRIMLNLGGIANFTYLGTDGTVLVTDTGPSNTLMDAWAQKHFNKQYDYNAEIAKSGSVSQRLLDVLLKDKYYELPIPKSTGPEHFNINMVENALLSIVEKISNEDVMASLNALTIKTVSESIKSIDKYQQAAIYVSGGGAHNPLIIEGLEIELPGQKIATTSTLNINPDAKEAVLFAILANECIAGHPMGIKSNGGYFDISMGKICFAE